MKNIIYRRSDNSIAVGTVDTKVLAALTGTGGLIDKDIDLDHQVAKHMMTVDNEAEFKSDWRAFLEARKDSAAEVAIRRYLTYARDGGATEDQAYAAIATKNLPADCVDFRTVENSDLPTDRYFRNAWEWSD